MKKSLWLSFFVIVTLLGCNQEEIELTSNKDTTKDTVTESPSKNEISTDPDYGDMLVYEIKETSILIAPPATDPEASYPVYEILIDKDTDFQGRVNNFKDLKLDDRLNVWTKNKTDEKVVAKIILVSE